MLNCIVCQQLVTAYEDGPGVMSIDCPQCGRYEISQSAKVELGAKDVKLHIMSAFIRNQFDSGIVPKINTHDFDRIANYPEKRLGDKLDTLLLAYAADLEEYDQLINVNDKKYIAKIAAKNEAEHWYVQMVLREQGLLTGSVRTAPGARPPIPHCGISPAGWMRTESLKVSTNSLRAFVAMSFSDSMKGMYLDAIHPAIARGGYGPFRIDNKEHNQKIDDEIIAEIQRSKFIVADFTEQKGGVYFEAGYAMGRGIPIIWTCFIEEVDKIHFDVRQYNTILWKDADDFAERLYQRIRATIGEQFD